MKFATFVNIQCRDGFQYGDIYRARLAEAVLAEELGFDAFCLAGVQGTSNPQPRKSLL